MRSLPSRLVLFVGFMLILFGRFVFLNSPRGSFFELLGIFFILVGIGVIILGIYETLTRKLVYNEEDEDKLLNNNPELRSFKLEKADEKLKELKELYLEGIITKEEYEKRVMAIADIYSYEKLY